MELNNMPNLPEETRKSSEASLERAVEKNGKCNFVPKNVHRRNLHYLTDFFTTLLEASWGWTVMALVFIYFGSWLAFAVIWYLILWLHGDLQHFGEPGWVPCIYSIQNFTSAFIFSVETQHTTGYGFHELTEQCISAVMLFCVQSIVGILIEGSMVGLVFVKLLRARRRAATVMFSKCAVIFRRDGVLTFMFRVADMRKSHILEPRIRVQLMRKRRSVEGEVLPEHREELDVSGDGGKDNRLLLFWPTNVIHRIGESSPLYGITQDELQGNNAFEIIVAMDGIVESTGLNVQIRSSYIPSEILWGYRFKSMKLTNTEDGYRAVDYSTFHDTLPVDMNPSKLEEIV